MKFTIYSSLDIVYHSGLFIIYIYHNEVSHYVSVYVNYEIAFIFHKTGSDATACRQLTKH